MDKQQDKKSKEQKQKDDWFLVLIMQIIFMFLGGK